MWAAAPSSTLRQRIERLMETQTMRGKGKDGTEQMREGERETEGERKRERERRRARASERARGDGRERERETERASEREVGRESVCESERGKDCVGGGSFVHLSVSWRNSC